MNYYFGYLAITLILSISVNPGYGQTTDSIEVRLSEELAKIYSQGHINGFSVAIVNQHQTLYARGFGYANVKQNIKYSQHTIQNIASISKTFIGVALLKAQELEKLNLDDPINEYLPFDIINPYFPDQVITIRQLATHTSSIKDGPRYEKNGYVLISNQNSGKKVNSNFRPPNEMMDQNTYLEKILSQDGTWYSKKNFIKSKPGEKFEYSNIGAGVAALVLENATGESFEEFTQTHIFTPLNMSGSGWDITQTDITKHSVLYDADQSELAYYRLVNYPDGGLITSSADLGKYLSELIAGFSGSGKLLSKESYEELFAPQLTEENYDGRNDDKYNDEYNMGIFMGLSAQGQIGHTGGDPGTATIMFFNTKTKIGKLLIANTNLDKDGINEFIGIWLKLEEYENALSNP